MRTLIVGILLTMALNANAEPEAIVPQFGVRFGEIVRIEAEFVSKPKTYHDQNIVKEPFLISVIAVNGHSLKKPIVMEYRATKEMSGLKEGKRYLLDAYEDIYTFGDPSGWEKEISQFNYRVIHQLIVKPATQTNGQHKDHQGHDFF